MSRFAGTGRFLNGKYLTSIGKKPEITFKKFAELSLKEAENVLYGGNKYDASRTNVSGYGQRTGLGKSEEIGGDNLFSYAEWKSNDVKFGEPQKPFRTGENLIRKKRIHI